MRLKCLALVMLSSISLCGCKNMKKTSEAKVSENKPVIQENTVSLLEDTSFESGFNLLTTSTENGRALSGVLDYDGEAKGDKPNWQMAQWWTHNDFINSAFTKLGDGRYKYENDSRSVVVNQKEKRLTMNLDSSVEYAARYGRTRKSDENWSHFLIEQSFKSPQKLAELKHLFVSIDFSIDKSIDKDIGQEVPCSQVTWYFTITDIKNGDPTYESGGNDFFWFGLPLYDSRFDFVSSYKNVDSGFVGATNKLIYSLDSNNYIKEKIRIGKIYHVELDILPYIKEAYAYGIANGAMSNTYYDQLYINYMNLGWELPGAFDVGLTIQNLKVFGEKK